MIIARLTCKASVQNIISFGPVALQNLSALQRVDQVQQSRTMRLLSCRPLPVDRVVVRVRRCPEIPFPGQRLSGRLKRDD